MLEAVGATGSITSAAKRLGMSYRRAWLLVEETNALFRAPAVETMHGGPRGGGAQLTAFGSEVVRRYRRIEGAMERATRGDVRYLEAHAAE